MEEDYGEPLTDADISRIFEGVHVVRPKDLDEKLFTSVLENIGAIRIAEIKGIEDRPLVKDWLLAREQNETTRAARLGIKIDRAEQQEKFFPSAYDDALPKFYTPAEKEEIIKRWIAILSDEMNVIFDITKIQRQRNQSSERKPKAKAEQESEIFAGGVDDSLLEELPLSETMIMRALDSLDYSLFYQGDQENNRMDENVARTANSALKRTYENQLRNILIRPTRAEKYIELFQLRFLRALALPGKYAGNIAASSFGESATQQSLNTFHFAGDKNARKQVNGFAKFESIIGASENPAHPTVTIFLKPITILDDGSYKQQTLNGEQMRVRIPDFQETKLSDIIEDYRILGDQRGLPKPPRWEKVNDVIRGVNENQMYPDNDRRRINRKSSKFNSQDHQGPRILEIKFKIEELYFRRISLGQIAEAIEEISSKVRVVTSSIDIGLIYVFYEFSSITQEVPQSAVETLPEQAHSDSFTFFLKKVYYPSIQSLQIGGIWGIDYISVRNYSIPKALDDFNSIYNKDQKRMYVKFKNNEVYYWGLSPEVLTKFIGTKMRRFMPRGLDKGFKLNISVDQEGTIFSFSIDGLEWYDYTDNQVKPLLRKEVWEELQNKTRIPIYELLLHPPGGRYVVGSGLKGEGIYDDLDKIHNAENVVKTPTNPLAALGTISSNFSQQVPLLQQPFLGFQPTLGFQQPILQSQQPLPTNIGLNQMNIISGFSAMALSGSDTIVPTVSRVEVNTIVLDFDPDKMNDLGFDLASVAKVLEGVFSDGNRMVDTSIDQDNYKILIRGINPSDMDLEAFVEKQLKEVYDISDTIDEASLRWYFEAEGNNLFQILSHPDVDARYTRSDNPVEIFRTLGVEACRSILIKEIAENVKSDMNPVHIELLVDSMTFRALDDKPIAQNRNGLNKRHAEFIGRAFEKTVNVFMEAGLGEIDNLRSFPSKIMWGSLKDQGVLAEDSRIRNLQKGLPLDSIFKDMDIFGLDFPPEKRIQQPVLGELVEIKAESIQLLAPATKKIETKEVKIPVRATATAGGLGTMAPKADRRKLLKKK